ncbi:hypothetical protein [Streptomyces marispadix]|uniref:Uncharacterized protein n=1 Tax=Streptomyces marispadix TaxID=2922868 RepID=A0ABS9SUL2_9ACTN|nr:hypothetical protein [Streptomyces marispadix]MCH6159955.1 hypothetical protein [Streptomyces marispadix]
MVDFEQAFVLHNDYKTAERELYVLSLRILAFPIVIAGALLSAELISSTGNLGSALKLPVIWLALMASGLLNFVVVRAYVVTDRVQTESKHQVNRLRSLYLVSLAEHFPDGWEPVWGSTNAYLDTKIKLKAALLTPFILGTINALYVAVGLDSLLKYQVSISHHVAIAAFAGVVYLLLQLELTWNVIRRAIRH